MNVVSTGRGRCRGGRTSRRLPGLLTVGVGWGLLAQGCALDVHDPLLEDGQALAAKCEVTVTGKGLRAIEDDYLPNVVMCENGAAPLEALRAQAVAARTFLYYKLESAASVRDGQNDQVYSCGKTPTQNVRQAVKDTSGLVLQYEGKTIASFFVAGGKGTGTGATAVCKGGSDPTSTERYVTYNEGKSGANITQSSLGNVNPANTRNRGCFSQNGSSCLAGLSKTYVEMLRFYYGEDIQLVRAEGTCVEVPAADAGVDAMGSGSADGNTGTPLGEADSGVGTEDEIPTDAGCSAGLAGADSGSDRLPARAAIFLVLLCAIGHRRKNLHCREKPARLRLQYAATLPRLMSSTEKK